MRHVVINKKHDLTRNAIIKLTKEPNSNITFRRLKGTRSDLKVLYISLTEELIKNNILDEQDFLSIFKYLINLNNIGGIK